TASPRSAVARRDAVVRGVVVRGRVVRGRVVRGVADPDARGERLRPRPVARGERVPHLAARDARVDGERAAGRERRERDRDGDRLPGREVHRRERRARVEHVTAARAGLGPDRQPGLLERRDVALDRALAHLQRGGEPGAGRPRRARTAQLLGHGVEPLRPVHDPPLAASRATGSSPARPGTVRRTSVRTRLGSPAGTAGDDRDEGAVGTRLTSVTDRCHRCPARLGGMTTNESTEQAVHVVLVPGFWLGAWAWDDVVPHLEAAGLVPYAVTLPGLEPGTTTEDRARVPRDDQAAAVAPLVDGLHGRVA